MGNALTVSQAAARLQVSEQTIKRLVHAGRLPAGKVGRQWRIDEDVVDAILAGKHPVPKDAVWTCPMCGTRSGLEVPDDSDEATYTCPGCGQTSVTFHRRELSEIRERKEVANLEPGLEALARSNEPKK